MKLLSVIVPCYNEEEALPHFYRETVKVLETLSDRIDYELVLVDDGSKDKTISVFRELNAQDSKVRYVSFSRNFGKEAAMFAGLEKAKGDYIVIMDADLQDPPSLLPEMLDLIENQAFDCVGSRRVTRKGEPPIRSFFARCFYKFINRISQTEIVDGARDFRMMTRQMVDAILELREVNRFSKGLFAWVGFRTHWLEYENRERVAGETKWNFWKLFKYSIDGILAFSTAPLAMASYLGLFFCFLSAVGIVYTVIKTLVVGEAVHGFPTLLCVMLLLGGLTLFCIGVLGSYIAKIYTESKHRPVYLVKEEK